MNSNRPFILLWLGITSLLFSCGKGQKVDALSFDREQWLYKEGRDYPHRQSMYEEVLYSEELREMNRDEILELLGSPDRQKENYIYYLVEEKRMGTIVLHARYLVFLFTDSGKVEWIKLHE